MAEKIKFSVEELLEKDQKYFLKVTKGHHDNLLDKNGLAFLGLNK